MSELTVRDGKIVRRGFYRAPDGGGAAYTNQVKNGFDSCIFCPESLDARGVKILESIGSAAHRFYVFDATPAYDFFDAQEVVDHRLIVPEVHVEDEFDLDKVAHDILYEYIKSQRDLYRQDEDKRAKGLTLQHLTRSDTNPSKSIGHLHTHLLGLSPNPVSRFEYDISAGVTALEVHELSPQQLHELKQSRQVPDSVAS